MRFVVYGAGAIGGVLGGLMHRAGLDVTLIARGQHLQAIRSAGLQLRTPDGSETLAVPAVGGPDEVQLSDGDTVLLAMKSQDTEPALRELRATAPEGITIACVQNGVANERAALRLFDHVVAVCVLAPCAHLEPGVVVLFAAPVAGVFDTGDYPSGAGERAEALAAAFRRAGYASEARDDVMRWKYTKLVRNLGNAIEAVCGPAERASELGRLVEEEGLGCLRAAGVDFVPFEQDLERRRLIQRRDVGDLARPGGSTWQSLTRSTGAVEVDYLSGEIALLGRLHGFPTPLNLTLQRLATRMAARHEPPGTMTPAEVLQLAAAEPGVTPRRSSG